MVRGWPIGVGRVDRIVPDAMGPRNAPIEAPPKTRIPVPIGVGDSGISLGEDTRDDDYYVNGVRPASGRWWRF